MTQQETMLSHITACKASGLTAVAYCRANNLKAHNYYYWYKKLFETDVNNFTKVTLPISTIGKVNLIFTSGHQLMFDELPSVQYLKQLLY